MPIINSWFTLLLFILLCEAAGILGSVFTIKAIPTWYKNLRKPSFNPPSWIFGPVWTILYLLMGISGYLILESNAKSFVLILFFVQLILNAIWTPIFFGAKKLGLAFIELAFMWLAILLTIIFSWHISTLAALLLLPYLFWVSFAGLLNFSLWQLNK
jgi:tryptophan-rich sensory protein